MSASREKKRRQDAASANNASRTQDSAAPKSKTKLYVAIGVVAAVLVAALLIWDAGFIQRSVTALTVGETEYSAAEVSFYYNAAFQEVYLYAQYGLNDYDITVGPADQTYTDAVTGETMTYDDYFRQAAVDNLTYFTALYEAALANGYSDADVAAEVDAEIAAAESSAASGGYASLKQMLVAYYGKMVTPSVFRTIVTRELLASKYAEDYAAALTYSEDDLAAYYEANADALDTLEYSYLYFAAESVETTDAEGNALSDEDIAAAEEQALAGAKNTADEVAGLLGDMTASGLQEGIEDLIEEYAPNSSSALSTVQGSSVTSVFSDWLLDDARASGDVEIIENNDNGFYVVVFHDRYQDNTPSADVRHILIGSEVDAETGEPTDAMMAEAKARAEDILASWESGKANAETFGTLAAEHSTDTGSNTNGGLYEGVYKGEFVPSFNSWLFEEGERQTGDTAILENRAAGGSTYYGYHIVYFEGYNEGDYQWKSTAEEALRAEDTTAWQEELQAALTVTEGSGMSFVQ